jgi:GNAT superfamily N-acetyltransferase
MRNPEIVSLKASQIQSASEILGDAFKQDPLFQDFTYPDDRRRLIALQSIGKMMVRYAYSYHGIYTTTEVMKGVAIWIPPHQFPLHGWRLLQAGAYALPFQLPLIKLLQSIPLFLKVEECHKTHLSQPHWYLAMLGVHSNYQNQGIGAMLMQTTLAEADRENMPCYLETSTAAAVRFYQRQGFEVVETINCSAANLYIWAMKREPQIQIGSN